MTSLRLLIQAVHTRDEAERLAGDSGRLLLQVAAFGICLRMGEANVRRPRLPEAAGLR